MKWDISDIKDWGPGKHEPGAVIPDAGNARSYKIERNSRLSPVPGLPGVLR